MPSSETILSFAAVLGIAKIIELVVTKRFSRQVDRATERQVKVEADATEVETIRGILKEVRDHSATKDKRIDKLEDDVSFLRQAVVELQDRERHQLVRAAAHEAWDQMSFALLVKEHPNHPAPPPLTPSKDDTHAPTDALPYISMEARRAQH